MRDDFISSFDSLYGGFSKAPKFPAPHFEKMLYDNSLLLDVLCKAYEVSLNPNFRTVAMEVKCFMRDELAHGKGGFYAAYDADSEGVEGYNIPNLIDEGFEDQEALEMARNTEEYIYRYMIKNKELPVSVRHDHGAISATLDGYGAYIRGLLRLFETTKADAYLKRGLLMIDIGLSEFWDPEQGRFFTGKNNSKELIYNPKELYDGAIHSSYFIGVIRKLPMLYFCKNGACQPPELL